MWWPIGSTPDFWDRGPGFESGVYHNDPDALQDHCENLREERETYPRGKKKILKKLGEERGEKWGGGWFER